MRPAVVAIILALVSAACSSGDGGGAAAASPTLTATPSPDDTSPSAAPSATPSPTASPTADLDVYAGPAGLRLLGEARGLGEGTAIAATTAGDAVYVRAPAPDSDQTGCEGAPSQILWRVDVATGDRAPAFGEPAADAPAYDNLVRGPDDQWLAMASCEGFLGAAAVVTEDGGGFLEVDQTLDGDLMDLTPWSVRFTPDGSALVGTTQATGPDDSPRALLIDLDGGATSEVVGLPGLADFTLFPDGSGMAVDGTDLVPVDASGAVDGPVSTGTFVHPSPADPKLVLTGDYVGDPRVATITSAGEVNVIAGDPPFGPTWAPDGSAVSYATSDGDGDEYLVLLAADGSQRLEIRDGGLGGAVFVDDGVVYSWSPPSTGLDDSPSLRFRPWAAPLPKLGEARNLGPGIVEAIMPDGSTAIISAEEPGTTGCEGVPAWWLRQLDLATGQRETLMAGPDDPLVGRWVPGGSADRVAVVDSCEGFLGPIRIATAAADGRVTDVTEIPAPDRMIVPWTITWTSDGQALLGAGDVNFGETPGLYRIDLQTGATSPVRTSPGIFDGRQLADGSLVVLADTETRLVGPSGQVLATWPSADEVRLAPDGRDVALGAYDRRGLLRVQPGYDPEPVARMTAWNLNWSATARAITFFSSVPVDDATQPTRLWLTTLEPSAMVRVAVTPGFGPGLLTPDEQHLVYSEAVEGPEGYDVPELRIVDVVGLR